jgi:hypothetical protein
MKPPSFHVIQKASQQNIIAGFLIPRNQII